MPRGLLVVAGVLAVLVVGFFVAVPIVLHRNLTIDDGELTPTLKVKRAKVHDHFSDDIEKMYAEDEAAVQPRAQA